MVDTREFIYHHDGVALRGQLARPAAPGPHPAVLVMHSALGLDDHMCRRAADLADLGYIALATDMYGTGLAELTREQAGMHFLGLRDAGQIRPRVTATFDVLRSIEDVDANRLAAIGFCFGGQCVLELARSGAPVRSVVSFHGLLTTTQPAESGAVTAKVLSISGAQDPYVPAADVAGFTAEMTAAGADWQTTVYGTGQHAFTSPRVGVHDIAGTAYDPALDRLSWAQATTFLAATLEPTVISGILNA